MNKRIGFNIGAIVSFLAYTVLAVLFTVLQTTLVCRYQILDAVADIVIGVIVYLGIYRGEKTAALFGLFIGLCIDGLSGVGVSFLPLFYCLCGFVCATIGSNAKDNAKFAAFLVTIPAVCLSRTVITFIDCLLKYGNTVNYKQFLLSTALPEFLSTLILCLPVFLIVKIYETPLNFARRRGWID